MPDEDKRLYAKLVLDFPNSPKIAPLSDRAFREYIECLLWSTRLMTDGFIDQRMVPRLFSPEGLEELTTNDPVAPSLLKVDGGLQIHDFEKHQNTRSKIEAKREAGRLGGLAKASKNVASARKVPDQKPSYIDIDTDIDKDTKRVRKGSRIKEDFQINDDMRIWAKEKAPEVDLDVSTEKFVNYWLSKPTDATKLDWVATWRNWILNEKKYSRQNLTNSSKNLEIVNHFASIQEN